MALGETDPQDAERHSVRSQRQCRVGALTPRNQSDDAREPIGRVGLRHQPDRLPCRRRIRQRQRQIPHHEQPARRPLLMRVSLTGQRHDPVAHRYADHNAIRAGSGHGLRDQQLRSINIQGGSRERAEHHAQPVPCAALQAGYGLTSRSRHSTSPYIAIPRHQSHGVGLADIPGEIYFSTTTTTRPAELWTLISGYPPCKPSLDGDKTPDRARSAPYRQSRV
jgi:hypothetical protein